MIYVHFHLSREEANYLSDRIGQRSVAFAAGESEDEQQRMCRDAEIILGNPPVAWLRDVGDLRWMQLSSAGFRPYTALADEKVSFQITNCAGLFGTPVAETALAGILALLRRIPTFVRDQEQRHWRGAAIRPELGTLSGKRVIVLGSGSIGGRFRQLLDGFDCRVATMGNHNVADFHTLRELDARLPEADVVMAALPDTEATRDMFDAPRLSLLSSTCIFANVGRGNLVDEQALLARLVDGTLGGAVLDVTRNEPLGQNDPLWKAPRTVLTQHSAGGAQDERRRIIDRFLHNLARYDRGRQLDYSVDLHRGY
ncbi:phosphoglycerate dehydrogenase-like enzyme [Neolewinella xylanilytica]|uniref:Phosphoglycerate dehydrogenase-like enzyme n=1 Tax=Neolewinella xylanilytica TaxID=1514080 RepID=A0A2S6I3X1_9BACT|nr:D-2-hydroxyacid dehydrogenase [Neolewinella xylanilytica]PPK85888.1 phosphoglycerate dehydrogenase-like enzyme [Neolewinella xylanilytica]